jgi:hypothetical protein
MLISKWFDAINAAISLCFSGANGAELEGEEVDVGT